MCVAWLFLFDYFLSTRCVYPQIGRAFEAPIVHKTLLCDHMLLLAPFIAYFLKKIYSLRKNTLIFLGFERGLSHQSQLVFICVLLELGLDWEKAA